MQRILSVQMSRSQNEESSEYVTKRLCCSFLFTVAFFSILGGFLLGRYTSDKRNVLQHKQQLEDIRNKVLFLQKNIDYTFQNLYKNCSYNINYLTMKCNQTALSSDVKTLQNEIYGTLDILISCFGDELCNKKN